MRPHRRLWWKVRIGDGPWIPNTLRIPQYTIIPREYHSTRRIPQGTTLCHVDLRVKQHDAQNCFAKNTSRCLTNITDHRCLPPQTLFSLQHVWSFPDENPGSKGTFHLGTAQITTPPCTQFIQLFHFQKMLTSIWAGGALNLGGLPWEWRMGQWEWNELSIVHRVAKTCRQCRPDGAIFSGRC